VLPLGQGHVVAEPLVGQLVDDHRVAAGGLVKKYLE
jgi:hypothetical protein